MRHTQQMGVVQYLNQILAREMVDTGPSSPVLQVAKSLVSPLQEWAGDMLLGIYPDGSFAKGTAVLTGTDIDLFISVSENCPDTLGDIYEKLFKRLQERGLSARRQDVSINITVGGYSVDLVPAKRQNALLATIVSGAIEPEHGLKRI